MKLAEVRKQDILPFLGGPDGKTQVTVKYRDGKPIRVDYVVMTKRQRPADVIRSGRQIRS